ncbi:MAG: hypothetical protein JEZ00_17260 [Anaerolineaceae bacterium]|nr:hypothetical protein [Anaerolineaceae bacterium]
MIKLDRNILQINGKAISFKYPIVEIINYEDLVILMLGVHPRKTDLQNIFAVNSDVEIVWQIEEIPYKGTERNSIVYMTLYDDKLLFFDDLGNGYFVDLENGCVSYLTKNEIIKIRENKKRQKYEK